jgi:hypothetical protein
MASPSWRVADPDTYLPYVWVLPPCFAAGDAGGADPTFAAGGLAGAGISRCRQATRYSSCDQASVRARSARPALVPPRRDLQTVIAWFERPLIVEV